MTEFGSFDNSTCKRVLDLLKPGDLTLGQVVIKRVAVVELGRCQIMALPSTLRRLQYCACPVEQRNPVLKVAVYTLQ